MPTTSASRFRQLTIEQFALLMQQFPFTRKITGVHMHHTWRPCHADYKGVATILGMWRYHTQTNGWRDIAQHISIAPDGTIWTGRDWNQPPVSASGHNGNNVAGPFMFEIIGNFDTGQDRLEGAQRDTVLKVIALVQQRHGLPVESLHFHNHMATKSCPGTSLNYDAWCEELQKTRAALEKTPLTRAISGTGPFGPEAFEVQELIELLHRGTPPGQEPGDAEPEEELMSGRDTQMLLAESDATRGGTAAGTGGVTPEMLNELRPYVINLTQGRFSTEGLYSTTAEDVAAIFEQHLPQAIAAHQGPEPLRIVFYAHGGLVKESSGLAAAHRHIRWWRQNGVYPIYFVWETGFFETVGQLLASARQRTREASARDIWDFISDPLIESTIRVLQGARVWSGMKYSAEQASAPDGGAYYVAQRLQSFYAAYAGKIELHAVGHSAGSIFHSHFIPAALQTGVPAFQSLQLLAPAIRVDDFNQRLAPRIGPGKGIERSAIFTMSKSFELDDECGAAGVAIYHKSLLYLVHYAFEAERKAPILGLEVSLRADPATRTLFGLDGKPGAPGEVVWSLTTAATGCHACHARHHGDFDDDAPTMNSVLRRILNKGDNGAISNFIPPPEGARGADAFNEPVDWPDDVRGLFDKPWLSWSMPIAPNVSGTAVLAPAPVVLTAGAIAGRRRALCVGINRYPTAPLNGCVADAQQWAKTLTRLGFDAPAMLLDEQATREAILRELNKLIGESRAGDVIVFQYAGHGTTLPDVSGDENGGDNGSKDEAICPIDFADGNFLIDDDIGAAFDALPSGVNLTCFIDCCHSGTISRFAVGLGEGVVHAGDKPRFLVATPAMIAAHQEVRRHRLNTRNAAVGTGGLSHMREVLFAAALSSEVAWESNGHGDFTVRATRVLERGIQGLSNTQFAERVVQEFDATPRQHPRLYCAPEGNSRLFLQPVD